MKTVLSRSDSCDNKPVPCSGGAQPLCRVGTAKGCDDVPLGGSELSPAGTQLAAGSRAELPCLGPFVLQTWEMIISILGIVKYIGMRAAKVLPGCSAQRLSPWEIMWLFHS